MAKYFFVPAAEVPAGKHPPAQQRKIKILVPNPCQRGPKEVTRHIVFI